MPHGDWKLNDVPVPELAHCVDLDLGFTPATNLMQLRRLQPDSTARRPMRRPPGSTWTAAA